MKARRVTATRWCHRRPFIAQRKGFHLDADLAALRLAYQHHGGVTTKFLLENPATVRNFVKSYIEAVHRLKTDRAARMKIAAKYLRLEDAESLKKTHESSIDENKLPIRVS
jgi:ABC-type nitrate/sulfonate/bicarbonate transport system substrate-binding protein